jgi:hypothetical protein
MIGRWSRRCESGIGLDGGRYKAHSSPMEVSFDVRCVRLGDL